MPSFIAENRLLERRIDNRNVIMRSMQFNCWVTKGVVVFLTVYCAQHGLRIRHQGADKVEADSHDTDQQTVGTEDEDSESDGV